MRTVLVFYEYIQQMIRLTTKRLQSTAGVEGELGLKVDVNIVESGSHLHRKKSGNYQVAKTVG